MHLLDPVGVAHLKVVFYLLACEAEGVEVILEAVEVEEVAHLDVARIYGGIEEEGGCEGDICLADVELEVLYEVDVGR